VTITPNSNDTGAATVSAAMTFTSANWSTPQTVTVTGVADDDINNETVTISHTITGAGYAGVTSANVIASVTTCIIAVRRNRHIACWLCIKYHGVSAGCGFA
jgi:hypothetical protein